MSGTAEILQSYLISLGYQTDAISLRKFEDGLGKTGKRVLNVGTAVAGVAIAIEASAAAFAYSMRRMYFESELSGSTVKNLKAVSFAGKQVGISSEAMASSIHGMAQAFRLNPGLTRLVENFGVKVKGRDVSDVMTDFAEKMNELPEFAAVKFMAMFGMDPDTYHQFRTHFAEFKQKTAEMLRLYEQMGYDPEKEKAGILAYTEQMDKLEIRLRVLAQNILTRLAPAFKEAATWLDHILEGWVIITSDNFGSRLYDLMHPEAKKGPTAEGKITTAYTSVRPPSDPKEREQYDAFNASLAKRLPKRTPVVSETPRPSSSSQNASAPFQRLESQYGLPTGLLDFTWQRESNRGDPRWMKSKAGAEGHMGFMPGTAKQYEVSDPYNLEDAATGTAKMYRDLMGKYKGNIRNAAGAYNWGEGNMDAYLKTGMGKYGQPMPKETKDYMAAIDTRLGSSATTNNITVAPVTTINVTGTDAAATGKAVGDQQDRVLGTALRNLKGSVS